MKLRSLLIAVCAGGVLAVPVALAGGNPVASANGGIHWTIPMPNIFGVEVGNNLEFNARSYDDGSASGHFEYRQTDDGVPYIFSGTVTCMGVYGNRAKIGGIVERSTDPTIAVGTYGWFQVFDNGEGANAPPDQSSLMGFGTEAQNEAFCESPNLPRFGPWDVDGNAQVRQ